MADVIIATNNQLKRLQQGKSNFDYINFLKSSNQVNFFCTFLIDKIFEYGNQYGAIQSNLKLMYIKKQLRNIDWLFLSKSGLLQADFITLVLSKTWMAYNNLISDNQYYIPIKIFHYLYPKQLCKTHDLMQQTTNVFFDQVVQDESSDSSNVSTTSLNQQNTGSLLQKILRLLHQDRIQYSTNTERHLDQANSSDSTFENTNSLCLFDDFVQFIKPNLLYTQNKSSYYSSRFVLNGNYDCGESSSSYNGYKDTQPKPILQFTTIDKKYMDLYNPITWEYIDNNDGTTSTSSIIGDTRMYISDEQRFCGLDRINLLKYQDELQLEFVCKYYTMKQICQYYNFTSEQLLDNIEGLVITYQNEQNQDLIPLDIQTLLTYNSFDMNDPLIIQFYNNLKTNPKYAQHYGNINAIIKNYQRLINNQISSSNSSIIINSSIMDNYFYLFQPNEINTAPSQIYSSKFKCNILPIINKSYSTKKSILYSINNTTVGLPNDSNIDPNLYYASGNTHYALYRKINNITNLIKHSMVQEDEMGTYINVCVRCHQNQISYVDKGSAIQHVIRSKVPNAINNIIGQNGSGWGINENGQRSFIGDFYQPSNKSCDQKYITCGMYNMLLSKTLCFTVLKAIVYIQDIIAILQNQLLACQRVKIVDNRLYYPQYSTIIQSNTSKMFISEQNFESF